MRMPTRSRRLTFLTLTLLALAGTVVPAWAQTREGLMGPRPERTRLGGHVGFVVPAVRVGPTSAGGTTTFTDRFIFGFPAGLTIRPAGALAVDLEVIPTLNTGDDLVVTLHPGALVGFAAHYAAGLRLAYDAGSTNRSYGVTALVSRGFALAPGLGGFVEFDVPVRRQQPPGGTAFTSIAFAAHVGLTF